MLDNQTMPYTMGHMENKRITAATINAELRKRGIAERIRQGRGYVYFTDGDSFDWYSSTIPVCYVSDLVIGDLETTMCNILEHRDFLVGRK